MSGTLTLIPTPICDERTFSETVKSGLLDAYENSGIIVVEEHKIARRKWIKNELPREAIDQFICLNEHTKKEVQPQIMSELRAGKNVYLLSDCGLPAFCDPGQELVSECHDEEIKVTAFPFDNSIALALALSGFDHSRFVFEGFISRENREKEWKRILSSKSTIIVMDTPYRLKRVLEEMEKMVLSREVFVGIDLNTANELLVRGSIKLVVKKLQDINKREYVIVIGPHV